MTTHTRVQPFAKDATDPQKICELLGNDNDTTKAGVATGKSVEILECERPSKGEGGGEAMPQRPSFRKSVTSGRASFSEPMKLIGQQTLEIVREKRAKKKWRRATYLSIVMAVIGFIIMFGVVVVANEFSKELKTSNEAHEMRAPTGELLTVGQAKSYATLFDLPAFHTETLAHLQQLTIVVTPREGGHAHHATLSIVSAMKGVHATSCTLFGASGSKVVIDSTAKVAFAVIDGANYIVHDLETTQQRQRRLGALATPRLHSEDEFFTAMHGFNASEEHDTNGNVVRRRLQTASEMQGYAEFALAAARGVLDHFTEADGVEYTSIYMTGTMYGEGHADGAKMSIFYSKIDPTAMAVTMVTDTQNTLFSNRVDNSSALTPYVYMKSPTGALQSCVSLRAIEDSPMDGEENSTISQGSLELAAVAVDGALTVVLPDDEDGEGMVFVVDEYVLDASFDDYGHLEPPSDDDCIALAEVPTALPSVNHFEEFEESTDPDVAMERYLQTVVNDTGIHRRLSSARSLEDVMAEAAEVAREASRRAKDEPVSDDEVAGMEEEARARRRLSHITDDEPTSATSEEIFLSSAYSAYNGEEDDTCKKLTGSLRDGCKSQGYDTYAVCKNKNARATITSKKKRTSSIFSRRKRYATVWSLNFAGTDDKDDAIADLDYFKTTSPRTGTQYHGGFYKYMMQLQECVNGHRDMLRSRGIELDYITGHSLGGAAATIYAQEYGNAQKGVATWGAPKSNYQGSGTITGWRFFHSDDLVSGNFCAANWLLYAVCPWCAAMFTAANGGCPLSRYTHMLSRAYEYYDKLVCTQTKESKRVRKKREKCSKSWWKFWCWFEWFWSYVVEWIESCGWRKKRVSASNRKASDGWNLVNAGVHTKYGEWEARTRTGSYSRYSKVDYSVVTF